MSSGIKDGDGFVDLLLGGHDHCYVRMLNPNTDVFIQKSSTDFECFTNLTILFGVILEDYEKFRNKL